MSRQLACPHGHLWEVRTLTEANHCGTPSVCPVCGATPATQHPLTEVLVPERPRIPKDASAGPPTLPPPASASAEETTELPATPGHEVVSVPGRGGTGAVPPRRRRWFLALGVLILAGVGGGLFGLHRWARHQLRTAEGLLADLRFEETGRLLDDYLRIRPSDAEARLVAARAKRRAGDPEAAEHHLNEFDRLQGRTPASSLERVLLLAERGALGDMEVWLRSRLKKGDPEMVPLLEALARNSLISGRQADALTYLDVLLAERPLHPRASVWRAQILGQLGEWNDALEDAQRAVELRPGFLEARLVWAEANERVGQTEKAVREYGWLYERGQKSPDVVLGLGRCWQDLARFAQARHVLDAFLAEQPARADVLVERGRLALREGGTTPAEPYLRRAVVADPNNLDAHRLLLRCLEEGGNPEESARVDGRLRQLEIRAGRIDPLRSDVKAAPNDLAAYSQRAGRRPGEGGRP